MKHAELIAQIGVLSLVLFMCYVYFLPMVDHTGIEYTQVNYIPEMQVGGVEREIVQVAQIPDMVNPIFGKDFIRISEGGDFGYRYSPWSGNPVEHLGIDLFGAKNAQITAALSGKVLHNWLPPGIHNGRVYKGHKIGGGYTVIDHGNGLMTHYMHNSQSFVHEGETVTQGQVIARQGATGMAKGQHLHFAVSTDTVWAVVDGEMVIESCVWQNPRQYIKEFRE